MSAVDAAENAWNLQPALARQCILQYFPDTLRCIQPNGIIQSKVLAHEAHFFEGSNKAIFHFKATIIFYTKI